MPDRGAHLQRRVGRRRVLSTCRARVRACVQFLNVLSVVYLGATTLRAMRNFVRWHRSGDINCDVTSRSGGHEQHIATSDSIWIFLYFSCLFLLFFILLPVSLVDIHDAFGIDTARKVIWHRSGGHACIPLYFRHSTDLEFRLACREILFCC